MSYWNTLPNVFVKMEVNLIFQNLMSLIHILWDVDEITKDKQNSVHPKCVFGLCGSYKKCKEARLATKGLPFLETSVIVHFNFSPKEPKIKNLSLLLLCSNQKMSRQYFWESQNNMTKFPSWFDIYYVNQMEDFVKFV